jgi:hypothetical protein
MARFPKGYVKPTGSCESCLAWGNFSGRPCPACCVFGRAHNTAACTGCRRIQLLKWNCCHLCRRQARLSAKNVAGRPADETDVRDRLAAVRHRQLFFVGMRYRRRPAAGLDRGRRLASPARRPAERAAPRRPAGPGRLRRGRLTHPGPQRGITSAPRPSTGPAPAPSTT